MAEVEVRVETDNFPFDFLIEDDGSAVDISAATTKNLIFTRPDGTEFIVAASFKTNGSDGYLRWTPASGELNQSGQWFVEADIRGISNWNGPTRQASFWVQGRLKKRQGK